MHIMGYDWLQFPSIAKTCKYIILIEHCNQRISTWSLWTPRSQQKGFRGSVEKIKIKIQNVFLGMEVICKTALKLYLMESTKQIWRNAYFQVYASNITSQSG